MNLYVKLAREAIENYVKKNQIIEAPSWCNKDLLNKKAGTFVSLHKKDGQRGKLRGCIGTFLPTQDSIALEIIKNAVSACSADPRFSPVSKDELKNIECSVDILSPPKRIHKLSELDPKEYGVIVKCGSRTGLLLPDLEGIKKTEEQVWIACQKAGINPQTEQIEIFRFSVERHKEK